MSTPNAFDQYARDYDATVQAAIGASGESVQYFADIKAEWTRRVAPDAKHILDFGCGIGNTTRALQREFRDAKVVGTDPSSESLAAARARSGADVRFVQTEPRHLPFDDNEFDTAIAACVFHHIHEGEQGLWLRELARVLRPGGRLVLFEHNPLNPLTRRVVQKVPFDKGVRLLGRAQIIRLARAPGFRIASTRYYFFFPRALAFLRPLERVLGWVPVGAQYMVVAER